MTKNYSKKGLIFSFFLFVIYFIFNQYSYSELSGNKSIDDNFIDTLVKKADQLSDEYRYDEAMGYYDKVLGIQPNNTHTLNNKDLALDYLGRYNEAIQYYDKVLEIDPSNIDALDNKNAVLDKLDNIDSYDESTNEEK
jgi:tetratricopeptide (TPR) repeat protein